MADYIEREAALALQQAFHTDEYGDRAVLVDDIKQLPAADVAPVRHGRFIKTQRETKAGAIVYGFECSGCRRLTRSPFMYRWSFCPNCGARMDG